MDTDDKKKIRCMPVFLYLGGDVTPEKVEEAKKALGDFVKTFGFELCDEPPKDAVIED